MKLSKLCLLLLVTLVSCGESTQTRPRIQAPTIEPQTPADDPEVAKYLFSQAHHARVLNNNEKIITYADEMLAIRNNTNLSHYNFIPEVALDHEQTNEAVPRPTNLCGNTGSIGQRMSDCQSKNGILSTAIGKVFGNGGEGNWKLVVKTQAGNAGSEVWMDLRTQVLWSDNLGTSNWCKASGNMENTNSVNCATLSQNESWCTDDQFRLEQKGVLGSLVAWRLPTREDYLQADINGIRHVLPNNDFTFWTATTNSQDLKQAWTYHLNIGTLTASDRDITRHIRCLGILR
jgi:hypothetical protein